MMAIVISINFFIGFVFSGGNLQNAAGMRCLLTVTSFIYICLWLVLIRWTVPDMRSLGTVSQGYTAAMRFIDTPCVYFHGVSTQFLERSLCEIKLALLFISCTGSFSHGPMKQFLAC